MPRYKSCDYNQLLMVPVSLEEQLAPGTLEYAIHRLIEKRLDTSAFDERYRNDETGCTVYDPKVLLKVVLLGYSRGLMSSRKLEAACRCRLRGWKVPCRAPETQWNSAACIRAGVPALSPPLRGQTWRLPARRRRGRGRIRTESGA